jgi:sRNA-binding regulator protein Hfq
MNDPAVLPEPGKKDSSARVARLSPTPDRPRKRTQQQFRFTAQLAEDQNMQRQAELFYLQKQIHAQTPMVIVLEDGERVEGCIEWYDRLSLKVRGRSRMLIYKSAIKYMYKVGEIGQQG